jgi:hypothetical protein
LGGDDFVSFGQLSALPLLFRRQFLSFSKIVSEEEQQHAKDRRKRKYVVMKSGSVENGEKKQKEGT